MHSLQIYSRTNLFSWLQIPLSYEISNSIGHPLNSNVPCASVTTASVTVSSCTEGCTVLDGDSGSIVRLIVSAPVLNKRMWGIWHSSLANRAAFASFCGIVSEARKPKAERKRRASPTATSLLLRTSLTSFTSSRNFPDPRRLDALRRYPCQRNAAILLYRVYIATACLHFLPLFPSFLLATFLPADFFQFFSFVSARHSRKFLSAFL